MALSDLNLLFRRCLHRRISANEFRQLLKQYASTVTIESKDIVSSFLNCSVTFCLDNDPYISQYLQTLIVNNFCNVIDLLVALVLQWDSVRKNGPTEILARLVRVQTRIVTDLNIILTSLGHLQAAQSQKCVMVAARWLGALAMWSSSEQVKEQHLEANNLTEAIGFLLVSFLTVQPISNGADKNSKLIHATLQQALDQCMNTFPNISVQLMDKMSVMQKPALLDDNDTSNGTASMNMAAFDFEENIFKTPVVASRAATAVFVSGLLRTGSTIDDSVIFSFLSTRHQGNHAAMFNDLLFASLDALMKPIESVNDMYQEQCQVFMLNKLPSTLAFIVSSAFEPFSSEALLTEAWTYLNISNNTDAIATARRFLQICSFNHLLTQDAVNMAVGTENANQLKGLYLKDDLINQVSTDHSRGPRLVEKLLERDGNAGTVVQAMLEIMHNYCHMKETQHLKDMANAVVRKPEAINAIGLFVRPSLFLGPFCSLLDDWKWDEIHGESQPVYDEFGSILLLILAFKQRLNIRKSDLGIQQKNGFMAKYLASQHAEQELSKLSETAQKQLGDWIQALYIDEGLSDELTTNCSAQEFYMLVPTLLSQSTFAHSKGRLSSDALKAGLEYLLEPFLLPSLLSAFAWIEQIASKEPKPALTIMQALSKTPGSTEARDIHETILSMAADGLEAQGLKKIATFESIITSMQKTPRFGMDVAIKQSDIVAWNSVEGGVRALLSRTVAAQVGNVTEAYNPLLLIGAVAVHGPIEVVKCFLNLLIQFSGDNEFHSLLDLIATLIASDATGLKNAVQALHARLGKYLKENDALFAEAIVHLARRVTSYTNALTAQDIGMDHTFVPMASMNVANVNLDAGPAATFEPSEQVQSEDIDQMLNDAVALNGMDQVDTGGFDDLYDMSNNDYGDIGDLDLTMFD